MIVTALTVVAAPAPVSETHAPVPPAAPRSFAALLQQQARGAPADDEPAAAAEASAAQTPPPSDEAPDAAATVPTTALHRLRGAAKAADAKAASAPSGLVSNASARAEDARRAATAASVDVDRAESAEQPTALPWLAEPAPMRGAAVEAGAKRGGLAPDTGASLGPPAPAVADAPGPERQPRSDLGSTPVAATPQPVFVVGAAAPPAAGVETLSVAAPVHTPAFAEAFAVQVSVLVSAGVQHAELHLNPSETGPVSVQIVVDGTAARIEFGADLAATRQAIEASLPELASALHDAGLTLHGGGVSQHARQRDADSPDEARGWPPRNAGEDEPVRVATASRVVRAGGIDLYA